MGSSRCASVRDRSGLWNGLIVGGILAMLMLVGLALTSGSDQPRDRAGALEGRLRCPVCKQVSIRDSPSETAAAMRRLVAAQVEAGRSDEQVVGFFQARYGDWILLDPPAAGRTRWLFVLPAIAGAAGLLLVATRAGRPDQELPDLDDVSRARVAASLAALPPQDEDQDQP